MAGLCTAFEGIAVKICLISVEIFAWGKFGGFGRATRTIGGHLAHQGHEVFAVIPRRGVQKQIEMLDGITVLGYEPTNMGQQIRLLGEVDADLYHSQEPSFGTFLAQVIKPDKKHIVTLRDPRSWQDWKVEYRYPSSNRFQVVKNWLYEDNPFVSLAVRNADGIYAASHTVAARGKEKYKLKTLPAFLPTPVPVPDDVTKASRPLVCFIARFDRRKRPEIFFRLAGQFPHVQFIAMGESRNPVWDMELRKAYAKIPNLKIFSFVDQFRDELHRKALGKSWIMVNTAVREGLPNSLIEAAVNGCAILSRVNPDQFATRFGFHAQQDEFEKGLAWLLEENRWWDCGRKARVHAGKIFSIDNAMQQHISAYHAAMGDG